MFADSLLETTWAQRTRRRWTTLSSFGLQALMIGCLLLLPFLKTVGLPSVRVLPTPVSWGTPPPAVVEVRHQNATTIVQSNLADNVLIAPREIPREVAHIEEVEAPPQMSFNGPGVPGGTGNGSRDAVWDSLNNSFRPVAPRPATAPPPVAHVFRTSTMLEGSLIRRVQPVYPKLAITARIQGSVMLAAVISKAGTIENLQALSGRPMLIPPAIDAVSKWRYRPYILNSEPIEVETRITVNFVLDGK